MKYHPSKIITIALVVLTATVSVSAKLYFPKQPTQRQPNCLLRILPEVMLENYDLPGSETGLSLQEWASAWKDFMQLLPPPPQAAGLNPALQSSMQSSTMTNRPPLSSAKRPPADFTRLACRLMKDFDLDQNQILSKQELAALFEAHSSMRP